MYNYYILDGCNFLEKEDYGKNTNSVNLHTSDFCKKFFNCLENRNLVGKEVNNTKTIVNQCIDNGKTNIELSKKLTNEINNLMKPFLNKNGECNEENILNLLSKINNIFINNENVIDMYHISIFMNRLPKILNKQYIIKLAREENQNLENIMKIIYSKISSKDCNLKGQNVGNIMYGFQVYDKDKYNILNILAKKIPIINDFKAQNIGNALYGLQNLKDVPEELLEEFAKKILGIELDGQAIGNALYGLHNLKDLDKSKDIISMLFRKLNRIKDTLNGIEIIYIKQIFSYYKSHPPKWLKDKFMDYIKSNKVKSNDIERKVYDYLKGILKSEEIYLCHYIDDGFELDIYIPKLKINIEIDSHYHDNKKNRNEKRDEHLKSNLGLDIIRIDNRVGPSELISVLTSEFIRTLASKVNNILSLSTI